MSNKILISVIICTFNRRDMLRRSLESVSASINSLSSHNFIEVIVVDNNSNDDTDIYLSNLNFKFEFNAYFESKQGLSRARNKGIVNANGNFILFLDDDVEIPTNFFANLKNIINKFNPDFIGGPIYPLYSYKLPFWYNHHIDIRKHSNRSGFVDCSITGANFSVKKSIIDEIGNFSSNFGLVGNKIILGDEKEFLERYRTLYRDKVKIYYSHKLSVSTHVEKKRISLNYLISRNFAAGIMRARITCNKKYFPRQSDTLTKENFVLKIFGKKSIPIIARTVIRLSLLCGFFYEYVNIKILNNE